MHTAERQPPAPEVQEVNAEVFQEIGFKLVGELLDDPDDLDQFPEPA
ncbi:hypothetical protein ACIRVF_11295 [Kitasatospora sp. NPDC101157]